MSVNSKMLRRCLALCEVEDGKPSDNVTILNRDKDLECATTSDEANDSS